jgi:hypothetical protein
MEAKQIMKNVVVMSLRIPAQWEEYRLWDFLGVLEWHMVSGMETEGEWWCRPVENSIIPKRETLRQYWDEVDRALALARIVGSIEADLCWIDDVEEMAALADEVSACQNPAHRPARRVSRRRLFLSRQ